MELALHLVLAVFLRSLHLGYASECGESTIPYSLEVLPSGQPILGCARPTCFGYQPNGHQIDTNAKFFRIDQQSDGFVRDDPFAIHPFDVADPRVYGQQQSTCEQEFQSLSCSSEDQWVGGIAPVMNLTADSIVSYKCCTYQPLRASTDRGFAQVTGGQIVVGGEVKENEIQYAFDYISNIEKKVDEEGDVYYDVNMRRFSCLDLQKTDKSLAEVLNAENVIQHVNGQRAAALQAPNVQVETPIATGELVAPTTDNEEEEVVVEEIVEQQAFVQPENTVPGQFPQPQPGFQPQPVPQGFQPAVQPQPFQQGFQPVPAVQQPAQVAAPAPYYGGVPVGYSAPAGLQLYYCFPGDVTVSQQGGAQKRMDELEIGDWVQAFKPDGTEISLVQVVSWLHRDPSQEAEFLEFYLDNGDTVSLTEKHLIYTTHCPPQRPGKTVTANPVNAENVKVGDCLFIAHREKSRLFSRVRVLEIRIVKKTGIYAPMTTIGHLLVNKIHVSCHSEKDNYNLQRSFFKHVLDFKNSVINYLGLKTDKETGIGYGANAIIEVLDFVIPSNFVTSF